MFTGEANYPVKKLAEASYINLKDGGKFSMMLVAEYSGTWTAEGGIVKVTADQMGSIKLTGSLQRTLQLKVSANGKALTPTEGGSAESAGIAFQKS